jgi:activator of HSP90 ATPase
MTETNGSPVLLAPTRRQMLAGAALAFSGLAGACEVFAQTQPAATKEAPSSEANRKRTALRQEVSLNASPERIYEVLLDSKQFAAFSGMPAEIERKEGGAFSMFGGMIVGRTVELVPNQRIVQAWRPAHWDAGVYSVVRFEVHAQGSASTVVLEHKGFPEGDFEHLTEGWNEHYWEPLKKFLA